jgi:hydroxymethylpyrimidine pyrophosphatase-like HAD family hydrolase
VAGLPLAQAGPLLEGLDPALLFSDVDGTLVGRDGSLLADLEGQPTLVAAEALVAAHRAGLEVVLVSGRTGEQLRETGRLLGLRDAIGELGTVLVRDKRIEPLWGEAPRDLGETPAEALARSGALAAVLDGFAGRLEPHAPWHLGRRGTALLRGQVDAAAVDALLAERGLGWARLLDNGRLRGAYPHLGPGPTHAYHLLPAGVSKAGTVAAYLAARGLGPERAAAIGDGPADLQLAGVGGAMFLVANGAWAAEVPGAPGPVVVTPSPAGQGWAEAVAVLLARMRPGTPLAPRLGRPLSPGTAR